MSLESLILIVDDEQHTREGLRDYLESIGYEVRIASDGSEAVRIVKKEHPDIVLTDLKMPGLDGLEVLDQTLKMAPDTTVMVLTAYGTVETAVQAIKRGAFHYLTKPVNLEELELAIKKALHQRRLEQENKELKAELAGQQASSGEIIGSSRVMQDLIRESKQAARSSASILLEGESGTGKELFARLIHQASLRANKPFVVVHCAALTDTLLTSELFGHERGAFTGATERKIGRFERAEGGTLFLDEVSELTEDTQVKLLRVLQDGDFERVGGTKTIHADIRLVCATNKHLLEQVQKGSFREDLYYRINVVRLVLPPLRERTGDIPELIDYYLNYYAAQNHKARLSITKEALSVMKRYRWPGNIRELRNVIERIVALSKSAIIDVDQIPSDIKGGANSHSAFPSVLGGDLRSAEKSLIRDRLAQFRGNKSKVARSLGISRRTLYRKIAEYGLEA